MDWTLNDAAPDWSNLSRVALSHFSTKRNSTAMPRAQPSEHEVITQNVIVNLGPNASYDKQPGSAEC